MKGYDEIVASVIMPLSSSPDLDTALREWEFTGEIIEYPKGDIRSCELCGHPLRYHYVIRNRRNGSVLKVGSECVYNFPYIRVDVEKLRKQQQKKKAYDLKKFVDYEIKSIKWRLDDLIKENRWNLQLDNPYWTPVGMSVRQASRLLFDIEIDRTGEKLRKNLDIVIRIGEVLGYRMKHLDKIEEYLDYVQDKKTIMRKPGPARKTRKQKKVVDPLKWVFG